MFDHNDVENEFHFILKCPVITLTHCLILKAWGFSSSFKILLRVLMNIMLTYTINAL